MDALIQIILVAGAILVLIGAIGLLRLPDFFSRLHSVGVSDTLGAQLVLIALILLSNNLIVAFKLSLIVFLLFLVGPVSSHALAKSAYDKLVDDSGSDQKSE